MKIDLTEFLCDLVEGRLLLKHHQFDAAKDLTSLTSLANKGDNALRYWSIRDNATHLSKDLMFIQETVRGFNETPWVVLTVERCHFKGCALLGHAAIYAATPGQTELWSLLNKYEVE